MKIITPAEFIAANPKEVISADKALKQINDNLTKGKLVTIFSGLDQINPLAKNTPEKIAIIRSELNSAGWDVSIETGSKGIIITLSAAGI